jgi:predicted  nucleic acid-binding Zn-ribbon protein
MSQAERERVQKEQKTSDLLDRLAQEEDLLVSLKETLDHTIENSKELEAEIIEAIKKINTEGSLLKVERDELAKDADQEILATYDRLINNKKDRVVVPIENRTCTGCHILVTAQDENLVRRGERLVFCEHCSRIQYWPEVVQVEAEGAVPARRRRRTKAST